MTGFLVLEGGAEFSRGMEEADRHAIELAGGLEAPIRIIPAAAAPDHNHERAGGNGVRWFQGLGATNIVSLSVIDRASADDGSLSDSVRAARLIYLLGGFPHHLGDTLAGSACWQAALQAHAEGAVIAGSSAGAMVLCEHYYDPYEKKLLHGLNLVPNACVLPHHNKFGHKWVRQLRQVLPHVLLLGIDESTAMINDAKGSWQVHGPGEVTVYQGGQALRYAGGDVFPLQTAV